MLLYHIKWYQLNIKASISTASIILRKRDYFVSKMYAYRHRLPRPSNLLIILLLAICFRIFDECKKNHSLLENFSKRARSRSTLEKRKGYAYQITQYAKCRKTWVAFTYLNPWENTVIFSIICSLLILWNFGDLANRLNVF